LVVRIVVLPSGKAGAADIVRSSGSGMLDQAALKAVRRWRFSPAQRAGRPVRATLNVPITFELQDRG
jgi:protein TonB